MLSVIGKTIQNPVLLGDQHLRNGRLSTIEAMTTDDDEAKASRQTENETMHKGRLQDIIVLLGSRCVTVDVVSINDN